MARGYRDIMRVLLLRLRRWRLILPVLIQLLWWLIIVRILLLLLVFDLTSELMFRRRRDFLLLLNKSVELSTGPDRYPHVFEVVCSQVFDVRRVYLLVLKLLQV